mmetsp:Transcript_28990/g.98698  ORF Transcript_28990/g.98698 Transcript_28990/m.98698 type:complete len:239 (+) Transcript_28990:685-1401(+)
MGSLPPSSSTSRFRLSAHDAMIFFPVAELPVIATIWTSARTSAAPWTPSPWTRPTTPGGSMLWSAPTVLAPTSGATSDGLTTTALPAASAGSASSRISSQGKFQGDSTATTPCGSRTTMPFLCTLAAFASAMRSRYSSLSTAPPISSAASLSTLPISSTMSAASSSFFAPREATAVLRSAMRFSRGTAAQARCASVAWATMAAISASGVQRTLAINSPVAGFVSSRWPFSVTTPCTIA